MGLNAVPSVILNGGGGSDSLTGPNQTNAWAITGSDAGTLNSSLSFTSIGNLIGGSSANTFSFVDGGSISGTINGGAANTLDFSGRSTGVTVTMEASGANKATSITGGWTNISTIVGSAAATDILVGAAMVNVWDVTGANAGNLNGALAFSSFENLTGGSTNDTFAFFPGGSTSGSLKGGAPVNTLDYSHYGSPVAIDLGMKTATGLGQPWSNIQTFIGTDTTDTLSGPSTNSTWSLSGSNAGTVGAYSFSGFSNLIGGSGNNTFTFAAGASVSGTVAGGGGTNTLDFSGYGSLVTVNLQSSTATGIGGTWSNIQTFKGANTTDTLVATDGTANAWALRGSNAGTVDGVSFTGFANLIGGSGNDTFTIANGATVAGVVDGKGGSNTLDYSAYTGGVTVNLGNATTGLANNSATGVNGGAANGIFNIGAVIVGAGNNYLTAVGDSSSVTFSVTGNGNNILVGGSGTNTLTVNGTGNNIVIGGQGVSTLNGGTGYNLLIGGDTAYDAVFADLQSILNIWKTAHQRRDIFQGARRSDGLVVCVRSDECDRPWQLERRHQCRDARPGLVLRRVGERDHGGGLRRYDFAVLTILRVDERSGTPNRRLSQLSGSRPANRRCACASRLTKAAYGRLATPCCTTSVSRGILPLNNATASSHRPGKTRER